MKAINNGQVDGFPPPEELRTVYVEHDIQGDVGDMNVVDFISAKDVIKEHGTTRDDVRRFLTTFNLQRRCKRAPSPRCLVAGR